MLESVLSIAFEAPSGSRGARHASACAFVSAGGAAAARQA